MNAFGLDAAWAQDLPVCFPARACADYPPYEADLIDFTTSLTPASPTIAGGCFVVLGVVLVLVAFDLRPHAQRPHPGLWSVALSAALSVLGLLTVSITDLRSSAISAIYGLEGAGGPDFYGSWWLVNWAGQTMTAAGITALVVTAAVAVRRLRAVVPETSTDRA